LQGRLGDIIHTLHPVALGHVRLELEGRLKAIDHEPQRLIDLAELIICLHSHQASTTHRLAHHGSILLFDMALIVLYRRTPSCEGQVLLLTIRNQFLVKELRTVIGINAEQRKGEKDAGLSKSSPYSDSTLL
jgi:hypothetical protein